ncbi:Ribonuclease H2, subunit B [Phytophthora cactorum]|nr:Ribonuclease H2, subunit B [Phytophthora cactorum]
MGRTLLALVPSALPSSVNLGRFHSDATDAPLLSVVSWTSRPTAVSTRTRQLALDKSKRQLLELQRLQPVEGARSWFVGNRVLQDGGVMVFSQVDVLFVLLDAAWGSAHGSRQSTTYWRLSTLSAETIEKICDVQAVGDEEGVDNLFVKANENKWEGGAVLANQELETNAKAAAVDTQVNLPGYKKKEVSITVTQDDVAKHYREAIDIWIDVLCDKFNVKKEVEVKVVAKAAPLDTFKRFDQRQTPENGSKRPTPSSAGSAKKKSKLANVDRTGMKSLTSFFGKK